MNSLDFTKLLSESIDAKVYVTMPEFKYDFEKELTDVFQDMGVETLFSPQADYTPMSSEWLPCIRVKNLMKAALLKNINEIQSGI